jgi:ABC-type amino acid transport substrate-binding protein
MAVPDGVQILRRGVGGGAALAVWLLLSGCGLIVDTIQLVQPIAKDEVDRMCAAGRVRVGLAVEPRQPFVFPAIWTDEGARITGLDVELVREVTAALSRHCGGRPLTPVIHLVRFRDLFVELNEGKLDLFLSAISANIPSPTRAGLSYSSPYFLHGGIGAIVRRPEVADSIRRRLSALPSGPLLPERADAALAGLTVAVQEESSAYYYAEANLRSVALVSCDSLPAAFEADQPSVDVILGKVSIFQYVTKWMRRDWQVVATDEGRPLLLMTEQYAVVMAEESYRLRRFVNQLLFELDVSGRLDAMRRRWLDESYAYPRRAAAEGLPFDVEKMVMHYDQGRCH